MPFCKDLVWMGVEFKQSSSSLSLEKYLISCPKNVASESFLMEVIISLCFNPFLAWVQFLDKNVIRNDTCNHSPQDVPHRRGHILFFAFNLSCDNSFFAKLTKCSLLLATTSVTVNCKCWTAVSISFLS